MILFKTVFCILTAFLVLQVKARTWGTTALWKPVMCGSGTVRECSEHFPKEENCTRAWWAAGLAHNSHAVLPGGDTASSGTATQRHSSASFHALLPSPLPFLQILTSLWMTALNAYATEQTLDGKSFTTTLPYTFLQFSKRQCLQQWQLKNILFYVFIWLCQVLLATMCDPWLWHANIQLCHAGSSSLTRNRTPALAVQNLSHWTTREVPIWLF